MKRIFLASIINPINSKRALFIKNGALVLTLKNDRFVIEKIGQQKEILKELKKTKGEIEIIDRTGFLIFPGFIDLHFHWVQDDVREMGKANLMDWLKNFTWPTEAKFKDKVFAKNKALEFKERLLSVGTFGGACYGSLHSHSTDQAFKNFLGDFFIGNPLMDINSPDYLTHTSKEALKLVENGIKKHGNSYVLTPRFAPTTSPEVMKQASKMIKNVKGFSQSHLSENLGEIDYVLNLYRSSYKEFKNVKNYTDIYKKVGMLNSRSIMAHAIHMSDEELKTLAKTKTSVAHCPTSNAPLRQRGLGSGLFDITRAKKFGVRFALGSDIGAGPYLSMFDVMKSFVKQHQNAGNNVSFVESLYLSTLAGAKILKIDNKSGSLDKKKNANFFLTKLPKSDSTSANSIIEKLVSTKSRKNLESLVIESYFEGKIVYTSR